MTLSDSFRMAALAALIGASVAAGVYSALAAKINKMAQEDSDATREWYEDKIEAKIDEIRADMDEIHVNMDKKPVHIYPNFFKGYEDSMLEADFIREKLAKLGLDKSFTNDLDIEWSTQEAFANLKSDYEKIHCTYFTANDKLVVNETGETLDPMESVGLYYAIFLSTNRMGHESAVYISNNYSGQDFVITINNDKGGGES